MALKIMMLKTMTLKTTLLKNNEIVLKPGLPGHGLRRCSL
ncbi:hypothetical protein D083_1691 [Dickeya solani RNS 08.23.3.1.A]|nr:hypothetical protein D083_1691 [Dickeya solani RNS 08.23.3.1.A]